MFKGESRPLRTVVRSRGPRTALVLALLALAAASSVPPPGARGDAPFSPNVRVNDDAGSARQYLPAVAVGAGALYAIWEDERNGNDDIYLAASADLGASWTDPNLPVTEDAFMTAYQRAPTVAVDPAGRVAAAWGDGRGPSYDIYFAASLDGGDTWTDPNVLVSDDPFGDQVLPVLTANATGGLFLAWEDRRSGDTNPGIWFAASGDGGATWSSPNLPVRATFSVESNPTMAVAPNGTIYVAWEDFRNGDADIYVSWSTDAGLTWRTPNVRVDDDAGAAAQTEPSVAVDPTGTVHLAWRDARGGDADIYSANSTDGGVTWSPNQRVNDDPPGATQASPAAAATSTAVHVVWEDFRNGATADVYAAASLDSGGSWGGNVLVTLDSDLANQVDPAIAADASGTVHAVWQDFRDGSHDVYYANSSDDGATWTDPNARVSDLVGTAGQSNPALVTDAAGVAYAAWEDSRNIFGPPHLDVYFSKSTDGGQTWTTPNVRVNDNLTGNQLHPVLAVDGAGGVYAAWEDWRTGEPDIYFARSLDGGGTWSGSQRINDDATAESQYRPALARSPGGILLLVWRDFRDQGIGGTDIWSARSTDGGAVWSANVQVSDAVTTDADYPDVAVDPSGRFHVAWVEGRGIGAQVYYVNSTDGGLSWNNPPSQVSDGASGSRYDAVLAVDEAGGLYVAWRDDRNADPDVYFAASGDDGQTWTTPSVRVSPPAETGWQQDPDIAAAAGTVSVVWDSVSNIRFANSTDGGLAWTDPSLRAEDANGTQQAPAMALGPGGGAFIAWGDYRNADSQDIYFASLPGSPPIPPPSAPRNLTTASSGTDILLAWEAPLSGTADFYRIYRRTTPRGIDLLTPYAATAGPGTAFTDIAASGAPGERYYVVRAVNATINVTGPTSNTAGAYTVALFAGPNAISLPLEPFTAKTVADLQADLGASSVSYMDPAGTWLAYPPAPDIPAAVGRGYVVTLPAGGLHTFTGYPGAMIHYAEGFGFTATEASSLTAIVTGGDIVLTWATVSGADHYCVRRSGIRQGFHTGAWIELGCTPAGDPAWTDFVDPNAAAVAGEAYYLVVPVDATGANGSSSYSIGAWTLGLAGTSALGLPLKPLQASAVSAFVGGVPGAMGMLWFEPSAGAWIPHFAAMPPGVYDAPLTQGAGYQVQVRTGVLVTFLGS